MEKKKCRISRWVTALFVTILMLVSLTGCSGNGAVETAALTGVKNDLPVIGAESAEGELTVEEEGHYTSRDEVALYIHLYGKLPSNFISKDEAEELGWKKEPGEAGQLHVVAPGMSIGGGYFGNYEGLLPEEEGRKYYECDINYVKGNRGAERIVYSNDGLIFYTGDHYESFEQLYPENTGGGSGKDEESKSGF